MPQKVVPFLTVHLCPVLVHEDVLFETISHCLRGVQMVHYGVSLVVVSAVARSLKTYECRKRGEQVENRHVRMEAAYDEAVEDESRIIPLPCGEGCVCEVDDLSIAVAVRPHISYHRSVCHSDIRRALVELGQKVPSGKTVVRDRVAGTTSVSKLAVRLTVDTHETRSADVVQGEVRSSTYVQTRRQTQHMETRIRGRNHCIKFDTSNESEKQQDKREREILSLFSVCHLFLQR